MRLQYADVQVLDDRHSARGAEAWHPVRYP